MLEKALKNLSANPLFQKYQLFVLPLLAIIISLVLVGLIDVPQVFQILNDEKVLAATNENYGMLQKKLITLQQINATAYKGKINAALTAIPPEKDIPGALGQVFFLVSSSNLRLDGIAISNSNDSAVSTSENGSYQIRLEVTGAVEGLRTFTQKIREAPRVMKVTSLEIAESKGASNVQATITLTVYYQALPTSIGAVEQDLSPLSPGEEAIIKKIEEFLRNAPSSTSSGSFNVGKSNPFE